MSRVVLFGAGKIAEEVYCYLTNDSSHEVVAFTADAQYLSRSELWGRPVVAFEEVQERYPPDEFEMFVAVGYQDLNRLRAGKCQQAKEKGYSLIHFVSSRASNYGKVAIGENCLVLENAVIQPCSRIGSNVFIWSGNHIGHHAQVGDHCYLCGQVVVSGNTTIEPYCFLGVNATIGHEITIGRESLIGAGTLITKNVAAGSVYIAPDTPRYRLDSSAFLELTKMR